MMLPPDRTLVLSRTSRGMRRAVNNLPTCVQPKKDVKFPDCKGLLEAVDSLSWCSDPELFLHRCSLREPGGLQLATELPLLHQLVKLKVSKNNLRAGGGRVVAGAPPFSVCVFQRFSFRCVCL